MKELKRTTKTNREFTLENVIPVVEKQYKNVDYFSK